MEKDSNCKGCLSDVTCNAINKQQRTVHEPFDVDNCPCGVCLIKGICSTMCEDYDKYAKIQRLNYRVIGVNQKRYNER